MIDIKPGEIETDGQVMIVKGRGWPKKRDGGGGATRGGSQGNVLDPIGREGREDKEREKGEEEAEMIRV